MKKNSFKFSPQLMQQAQEIKHLTAAVAAKLDKSDPFVYDRTMAHLRNPRESFTEYRDYVCRLAGIETNIPAMRNFVNA